MNKNEFDRLYNNYDEAFEETLSKRRKRGRGTALLIVLCMVISGAFGFGGAMLAKYIGPAVGDRITAALTTPTSVTVNNTTNAAEITEPVKTYPAKDNSVMPAVTFKQNDSAKNLSVSEIAALCADSVVEITTESVVNGRFLGQYVSEGAGSGVIISEDGYIVTNNHVIDGASTIRVRLTNGEVFDAELIGADENTDLAVIKIETKGLVVSSFGDSDALRVGESVVAIGNPLGSLGGTVTDGIISAVGREITIDGEKMTLLQTNTAINPGNSGGGLFDASGALIGIVNAKSTGEDVEGLGFAIPINTAREVIGELISHGYVTGRIDLGVRLLNIRTDAEMRYYGVWQIGCYIYSVEQGSAAAEAGLKSGDLIISINGKAISNYDDIDQLKLNSKVGDEWQIVVKRYNETNETNITLILEEEVPDFIRNK